MSSSSSSSGSRDDEADAMESTELTSVVIRKRAEAIQRDLEQTVLNTEHAKSLIHVEPKSLSDDDLSTGAALFEIKGERVRRINAAIGTTSSVQGWRRVLQHNLNVDWGMTIRHFLLFLFFGLFGGRTATSRAILLLGAPSVFVLQARPVKLWIWQAMYALLDHPPSILLSLLPAPQQAILSLDMNAAMNTLYGNHIVSSVKKLKEPAEAAVADDDDHDDDDDEQEEDDGGDDDGDFEEDESD
jgi:hypothetical protein